MADDNMIQANTTRDWGHQHSPLFKLPAEVRNNIYRETFAGSEIALVFDPPLDVHVVPVTGRRSIFVDANGSHNLLLTCAQVYLEALALYWSSTTVRSGSGRFSRGFFLSRIPELARPYIQHLRAVDAWPVASVKKLRGEVIGWPLSLAESLDSFPSLRSCSVPQWSIFSPEQRDAIREAVDRHPGVHIVEKEWSGQIRVKIWIRGGASQGMGFKFVNHTTGRKISWKQPRSLAQRFPDEVAFSMLMDPVPDEITQRFMKA